MVSKWFLHHFVSKIVLYHIKFFKNPWDYSFKRSVEEAASINSFVNILTLIGLWHALTHFSMELLLCSDTHFHRFSRITTYCHRFVVYHHIDDLHYMTCINLEMEKFCQKLFIWWTKNGQTVLAGFFVIIFLMVKSKL